jgi:hypothetical protein
MDTAPIAHIALIPEADAKLTPLEILADFADATRGWVYLERASRHYAEEKGQSALLIRHYRDGAPPHVDFAFAAVDDAPSEVRLVILDAPDTEEPLSQSQHTLLLDTFLEALRPYLADRSDHVRLHVERDRPDPASS